MLLGHHNVVNFKSAPIGHPGWGLSSLMIGITEHMPITSKLKAPAAVQVRDY